MFVYIFTFKTLQMLLCDVDKHSSRRTAPCVCYTWYHRAVGSELPTATGEKQLLPLPCTATRGCRPQRAAWSRGGWQGKDQGDGWMACRAWSVRSLRWRPWQTLLVRSISEPVWWSTVPHSLFIVSAFLVEGCVQWREGRGGTGASLITERSYAQTLSIYTLCTYPT